MPTRQTLGGIVHSYQRYDPARIPPPRGQAADLVSAAFEQLLEFGDGGEAEITEEQLAQAIEIDPSQLRHLGPSLESLKRKLEEHRRRILERYETDSVRKRARRDFRESAARMEPPSRHRAEFESRAQGRAESLIRSKCEDTACARSEFWKRRGVDRDCCTE